MILSQHENFNDDKENAIVLIERAIIKIGTLLALGEAIFNAFGRIWRGRILNNSIKYVTKRRCKCYASRTKEVWNFWFL